MNNLKKTNFYISVFISLACEKPFEGARGNLSRLFEKNTKRYYDLNKQQARNLPPDDQRYALPIVIMLKGSPYLNTRLIAQ